MKDDERARVVRAKVESLGKQRAVLDRPVDVGHGEGNDKTLAYDYAVIATGTVLSPPGTLKEEGTDPLHTPGSIYHRDLTCNSSDREG